MHTHHEHCQHLNIKYCPTCQVAYCVHCGKEWGSSVIQYYNWPYRWNTYPYTYPDDGIGGTPITSEITYSACTHSGTH